MHQLTSVKKKEPRPNHSIPVVEKKTTETNQQPIKLGNGDCICESGCQRCDSNYLRAEKQADDISSEIIRGRAINTPVKSTNEKKEKVSVPNTQGQSMAANERYYFEEKFKQDFSQIAIHRDQSATALTTALGTKAFTYGNHIYFNSNTYAPFTEIGRKIIAHELVHTNQQANNRQPSIQCWPASVHQKITKEVIEAEFSGKLSADALLKLAFYSGQLDQRTCNYVQYIQDFLLPEAMREFSPLEFTVFWPRTKHFRWTPFKSYALSAYESPNHGEANQYKKENFDEKTGKGTRTQENEDRMQAHLSKALGIVSKNGLTKQAMVYWGMALHVGQDRGSHQEGVYGKGHGRKKDDAGSPWNCDNPKDNGGGYEIAKGHTKTLVQKFIQTLTPALQAGLKSASFGDLAGSPGPNVGLLPEASGADVKAGAAQRFAYTTLLKRMIYDKQGMPKRMFGMMPYMWKLGLGMQGDKKKTATIEPQFGWRVTKPTPLSYLDLFTGPSLGMGMDHLQAQVGWSLGAQLGLIGDQGDINLMVNQSWTTGGNSTVLGISGTWDEMSILRSLGIR